MNKNRKPLDSKVRKKQAKEVKKGQALLTPEETPRTETVLPTKSLKSKQPLVDAMVKNMEIKKKKMLTKRSKRTTPDETNFHESPPANAHIEGQRWSKTLVKQSVGKGKALTAKIQKRATRAPKGKK